MVKDDPVRFGAEFGPKRTGTSTGVSLSTFKTLVWVSNLGVTSKSETKVKIGYL